MIEWMSFAVAGIFAGLIAGLLGLGGGLILVPLLLLLFFWQGLPAEQIMHLAVGTSMMTICITATSSLWAHQRHQNINWQMVWRLVPGLIAGAFSGAFLATLLSGDALKMLFAIFIVVVAVRVWIPLPVSGYVSLRRFSRILPFSGVTGVVSALVGIGGGTLVVPYLLLAGVTIKQAIGSAAACGLPIALSAVTGFILLAPSTVVTGNMQTGYIYWPAFIGISITSSLFAPVGVKLAKTMPELRLRQLFSVTLMLVAFYLLTF